MASDHAYTRRGLLRTGAAATATGAAVAGSRAVGRAGAQSDAGDFGGWLSDVDNYDGTVVDETGADEVTVRVGAEGNGGAFAFAPPAVRVDPGTTVVWEWTGAGANHNVVDEDGTFESELAAEAGHTFEQTLSEEGVLKYYCTPHRGLGMKGVVVVGSQTGTATATPEPTPTETPTGTPAGGTEGGGAGGLRVFGLDPTLTTMLAMVVLGLLSPLAFALLLRIRGRDTDEDTRERFRRG